MAGLDFSFRSGLLFFVGIYDEFRPMSPAAKLVAQIVAGTIVVSLGYTSTFFNPRIANTLVAQLPNILLDLCLADWDHQRDQLPG